MRLQISACGNLPFGNLTYSTLDRTTSMLDDILPTTWLVLRWIAVLAAAYLVRTIGKQVLFAVAPGMLPLGGLAAVFVGVQIAPGSNLLAAWILVGTLCASAIISVVAVSKTRPSFQGGLPTNMEAAEAWGRLSGLILWDEVGSAICGTGYAIWLQFRI